jgi:hypothetical protein
MADLRDVIRMADEILAEIDREKTDLRTELDAAREREKRLREALEAVVNAWPIPSAQFTAAMVAARVALAREDEVLTSDGSAVHSPQEG